jgi:nucleoside-diphosphate-sugar epimerase
MKALVTGGTGFSGKALCDRLLSQGHSVTALDYKEGLKTDDLRRQGARVVIGSVTDRAVVDDCMPGVEVVFHLAAAFRELNVAADFYRSVNVTGTRNVFASALAHKVRKCIYCSTCGVHGNVSNPPGGEDAPIKPADYYQQTKYEGEVVAREFAGTAMETCVIRPAAIYGPGDPERFFMIFRRVAQGVFPMFGSGRTLYHPLYIDNLTDAFMLAAAPGKGKGEVYLIADEEYLSIEALVHKVAAALGTPVRIRHYPLLPLIVAGHVFETVCRPLKIAPPIFPRRVDWYRQNRAFRIDKARRDLGYAPRVGIDEGLRRTAAWYRQEGLLA